MWFSLKRATKDVYRKLLTNVQVRETKFHGVVNAFTSTLKD